MAAVPNLKGVSICERDKDGECMFVWVYPSIDADFKELILKKCTSLVEEHDEDQFCFCQLKSTWYYIKRQNVSQSQVNKGINDVFFVITAQDFNPELYKAIADNSMKSYLNEKSTSNLLKNFLSMYTKGFSIKNNSEKLVHTDFDKRKAYMETCVKEIIILFGMESILIYMAMLLKKRVVVYSPKLTTLHHICRSLPAFVMHRLNWDIVYPFLHTANESEMSELKGKRSYVAGFTNAEIENKPELYDIFLNVSDGEIILNPHSKEFFQMGKMHKEIAKFLVQSSEDEDMADEDILKGLTRKTKDIINNLKTLDEENRENPQVTLEFLQSRNLTSAMQSFLFNLASAEGFVRL